MSQFNEFDLIDQATELFKLKVNQQSNFASGLLYPSGSPFSYGRPALAMYARVSKSAESDNYEFFACIRSIDDSGVSIFGPAETIEKAKKRFDKFVEFIRSLEYKCPTRDELREFCKVNGIQEDYW